MDRVSLVVGFQARQGCVHLLPPDPGLGVEINEKLIEVEAKKPQTYKWPGRTLPNGSIADY